jgi:two-component system cell cycle sensor histidine kinase/response regulator CckA
MKSQTILIVDDEQPIREYLRRILSREGFEILESSNGREALKVFGEQAGKINLVLMDISMPQMDGQTCALHMLKDRPHTPVIYMSGDMNPAKMSAELTKSPMMFLSKPFTTEEILSHARALLARPEGIELNEPA